MITLLRPVLGLMVGFALVVLLAGVGLALGPIEVSLIMALCAAAAVLSRSGVRRGQPERRRAAGA